MQSTYLVNEELVVQLTQLISQAQHRLLLTSPYIDFAPAIKVVLAAKKELPNFRLQILLKRNDIHINKSIHHESLQLVKSFANVDIRQVPLLHTKNYLSENALLFTSLSLHNFTIQSNIESGIYIKDDSGSNDGALSQAAQKLEDIFDSAQVLYKTLSTAGRTAVLADNIPRPAVSGKLMSTTQLAKRFNVSQTVVIDHMFKCGIITKNGITELGLSKGVAMQTFGDRTYIAYPSNMAELRELLT